MKIISLKFILKIFELFLMFLKIILLLKIIEKYYKELFWKKLLNILKETILFNLYV